MAKSQSLTVRVPLAIRRRGGRKLVVTPEGASTCPSTPPRPRVDSSLVKALGRAHRWKRLLEEGRYASISEMAAAEKIDRGYLGRILLLALLAPDIVQAILDGKQPPDMTLPRLMKPFPVIWSEQRQELGQRARACQQPEQAGHMCLRLAGGSGAVCGDHEKSRLLTSSPS